MAGAKQPVHWFLGGKGLGIQQGTSVWVGSPKSNLHGLLKKQTTHSTNMHIWKGSSKSFEHHRVTSFIVFGVMHTIGERSKQDAWRSQSVMPINCQHTWLFEAFTLWYIARHIEILEMIVWRFSMQGKVVDHTNGMCHVFTF